MVMQNTQYMNAATQGISAEKQGYYHIAANHWHMASKLAKKDINKMWATYRAELNELRHTLNFRFEVFKEEKRKKKLEKEAEKQLAEALAQHMSKGDSKTS